MKKTAKLIAQMGSLGGYLARSMHRMGADRGNSGKK